MRLLMLMLFGTVCYGSGLDVVKALDSCFKKIISDGVTVKPLHAKYLGDHCTKLALDTWLNNYLTNESIGDEVSSVVVQGLGEYARDLIKKRILLDQFADHIIAMTTAMKPLIDLAGERHQHFDKVNDF